MRHLIALGEQIGTVSPRGDELAVLARELEGAQDAIAGAIETSEAPARCPPFDEVLTHLRVALTTADEHGHGEEVAFLLGRIVRSCYRPRRRLRWSSAWAWISWSWPAWPRPSAAGAHGSWPSSWTRRRRHGFPTQALGEDAVFGVRFIDGPRPKTWMDLQKHDRELGLEWGMELLRRGLLVNPNEKFYISIAHTDADVDQTLEVVDGAFKVMAAKR